MTYDYVELFSSFTDHSVNLYFNQSNLQITSFSTDKIIKDYIAVDVNAFKIQIDMSIFDHIFNKTTDFDKFFDLSFNSVIDRWKKNIWDYKVFFKTNAVDYYDNKTDATYSYDNFTRQLIFYDTVDAVRSKTKYIKDHNLEDDFFWEVSADKKDEKSLIQTLAKQLGKFDQTQNMLNYSLSVYSNIKANMS